MVVVLRLIILGGAVEKVPGCPVAPHIDKTMAEARAALRLLVRAVDANVTSVTGNPVWRQAVFDEFRRHAGQTDGATAARLTQEARDIAFYLDSVREHKVMPL